MKKYLSFITIAILSLLIMTVRAQSIFSDFSSGDEGWVITGTNGQYNPTWISDAGNPGGCISGSNSLDAGNWSFLAPSRFNGDKSGAYNHSLSFDLKLTGNDPQFDAVDVTLIGGGLQVVYDLPPDTIADWQKYILILNENAGWHLTDLSGAAPSANQMISILANLVQLKIRGKYSTGIGSGSIDNVYLSVSQPYSTFDIDYEGWRIQGDAQGGTGMPNYHSSGGHPGGYLSAVDDVTGGTWYWQAPGKFLGDMSGAYEQNLKFDLKQSDLISQFDNYDVILQGPSFNLVFNTPNNPDTTWTPYSIELKETSGWHRDDTLGPVPSHSEFMDVLSNLQNLLIRGEFINGADSGCIDNVSMGSISGIPIHDYINPGELAIFPNPASDNVTLRFVANESGYFTITLLSGLGEKSDRQKVVYCSVGNQEIQLPLNGLPAGIYCCTLHSIQQTLTGKIIIR